MRVITGTAKSMILQVPEKGTRPLTDRIKTSIFDLINEFIADANVLDLYAGSGGFGIEALSRGAKNATFIDLSGESVHLIQQNLEKTKLIEKGRIVQSKVNDFIIQTDESYDIIFLDPPFDAVNDEDFSALSATLNDDGILIYRLPTRKKPEDIETFPLNQVYRKQYGKSIVMFFKK
jgi:16S rRNA (guanine(966)-N(2))-methyltransferase RsmD